MARWKTLRWPLTASALASLALTGCGAATHQPGASLHATAEKQLLTLVGRARSDVSDHNAAGAHTVLAEFVSEVGKLRAAGELTSATAGALDRQAHSTAVQISQQLPAVQHPASHTSTTPAPATSAPSSVAPADPGATTPPGNGAASPTAPPAHRPGPKGEPNHGHDHPAGDGNHPFPHGRGDDHGHGHQTALSEAGND